MKNMEADIFMFHVFNVIPAGFFNNLASGSNQRIYHNSEKQALLRRIYKENPQKNWYHFGDIDPDGYYILEHLRKGTGIDFEPLYMNVFELTKYAQYCKELTDKDRVKADNLIVQEKYVEVLQYMLNNNCKLEQEIISISQ